MTVIDISAAFEPPATSNLKRRLRLRRLSHGLAGRYGPAGARKASEKAKRAAARGDLACARFWIEVASGASRPIPVDFEVEALGLPPVDETLRLIELFTGIGDPRIRRLILDLVRSAAEPSSA